MPKPISATSISSVKIRYNNKKLSKSAIWVEMDDFYGDELKSNGDLFLVVGFDTEFKTPDAPLSNAEIREGKGKYRVLSYQVHCKLYDPNQPDAVEWGGVIYPNRVNERLSLAEVLTFAIWKGIQTKSVNKVPRRIYLVGHFTRADIPAFSDFKDLTQMISSVRNTFLSIGSHIAIEFKFPENTTVPIKIFIRDTMLLTPAASKSLKALGDLVGLEKIVLHPDKQKEQFYKANMDQLLKDDPELFERYALNDAVICVRYMDQLLAQCRTLLNSSKIPATLTSIGVDLLWKAWEVEMNVDPLTLLGKELVVQRTYSKRLGYFVTSKVPVDLRQVTWHTPLATECYHGGRNEQFWFGPAFEDDWTDYDLSSAYPTAMALIATPDWEGARVTSRVADFKPDTLGVANVDFEFPDSVRFPTMPVRTDNGLVFPLKGNSNCAAPEIALAKSLGAKLKIRHGVVIPPKSDTPIFGSFIKGCIVKRNSYPKGSLSALFWKEISNSSYGKTAQGLHEKRVYDLRSRDTKPLPPSKITNPFFASYITSFVRAILGELINSLPPKVCVFSCTTDGFLTNATAKEIVSASSGPLVKLFQQSRKNLTSDSTALEIKHRVRKPLGWRTRGQATLKRGNGDASDPTNVVLAKGGIYLPEHLDDVWLQNDHVVELFMNRTPQSMIPMRIMTGIRDMVQFDADLVQKNLIRKLSMEFDWKRCPSAVSSSDTYKHVAFATKPWNTVDEFMQIRKFWEEFALKERFCMKTEADYRKFAVYVLSKSSLAKDETRYMRKSAPDINRLRQSLGAAWKHSKAGLKRDQGGYSNTNFAHVMQAAGIKCSRADVENDGRKPFKPKSCPPTPDVLNALNKVAEEFPNLEIDAFFPKLKHSIDLLTPMDIDDGFVRRV